jgi:hypothetical protein
MCRDCKQLYDVVTRLRFADEPQRDTLSLRRLGLWNHPRLLRHAPRFEAVLNRLPSRPLRNFRWLQFSPQCPASPAHRIQVWNAPDKCPRCATVLEKNVLPYRIWE